MDVQDLIGEKRILYLSRSDLVAAGLLDYTAIVDDVHQGLCLHARGETTSEKLAIDLDVERDWKISALVGIIGRYAGVKWLGANTDNLALDLPRSDSIISLNDRETGRVLCVMDGAMISALRTGAYAALATEVLAQKQPAVVGLFGAGVISRSVLLCMAAVARAQIERVLVHDIVPKAQEDFVELMADRTGLPIEAAEDPGVVTRSSGITVAATTAMTPFIRLADVRPAATHIHLGGWEDEKTYAVACARPPNKIVCDDVDVVLHRDVQTVASAFHEGLIRRDQFHPNLGDILLGSAPGREGDELIYFNAVGLPVLDVAVASRLFEHALEVNLGMLLGSQIPHWLLTGQP
jgi:ornithine cyclodeaminase/alanine dehydrogenase-like protein (mu-crystallin family)